MTMFRCLRNSIRVIIRDVRITKSGEGSDYCASWLRLVFAMLIICRSNQQILAE